VKLLVMDNGKCGLDLAYRAQEAGHSVRLWVPRTKGGNERMAGKGIVPRVADWEPSMKWADLILPTDNCTYIDRMESYFNQGFPIFGCNRAAGELELDRLKGQQVLEKCGIETIPTKKFMSYKDAEAYIRKTGGTYVSKPIGEADKGLSYVSKSAADLAFKMQRWAKESPLKEGFVLQDCIDGTEMGNRRVVWQKRLVAVEVPELGRKTLDERRARYQHRRAGNYPAIR